MHAYGAPGTYQVTLEVVDPGSGTNTFEQAVTVDDRPSPGGDAGVPGAGNDAGATDPGTTGGGCCQAPRDGASFAAFAVMAIPVLVVLRRRRGRRR